jgi:hypothetical protein
MHVSTSGAVADILGVSARTLRRLRWYYQHYGYDGLLDRPAPNRPAGALPIQRSQDDFLHLHDPLHTAAAV